MYNDMPALLDPNDTADSYDQYDPVTGARIPPRTRRHSSSYTHNRNRSSGSFSGVPNSPLYGYTYSPNYFSTANSPYLSPGMLPSPQLVPHKWIPAYYDLYGDDRPVVGDHLYDMSPQTRAMHLPSPHASPYINVHSLPRLRDEADYADPRDTWASRIRGWITGDRPDPHGDLKQHIYVNSTLNVKATGLVWNVAFPPHTIRARHMPKFEETAFDPPLQHCKVVSPLMPWIFEISAHKGFDFITVFSLLSDIQNCFKRSIDRQVYDNLPEPFKGRVNNTYKERCLSLPDERLLQQELGLGIKRVDFLLDIRYFAGMQQVKDMYHTFEIRFMTAP